MSKSLATKLFRCLSEEVRVRLVRLLAEEELSVNELVTILEMPQSTLSRHISVLKESGLLGARRQGPSTFYRIDPHGSANGQTLDLLRFVRGLLAEDPVAAADNLRLAAVRDERRRAQRAFFDEHGASWDAFHARVADPGAKIASVARLVPAGQVVVDAGCGSGYLLPELALVRAHVIAVDHSKNQLQKAAQRAEALGMKDIEFRLGDLESLPIADAAVDAVFCYLSLHHVPKPEAAVRDMRRVLKPGGTLVITDFKAHSESWLADEHADLWLGFEPAVVSDWMTGAGFADTRQDERPYTKEGPKTGAPVHGSGATARIPKSPGRGATGLTLFTLSGMVPPHSPAKEPKR